MRPVVMAAIAQRQMPVESDLPSANGQFACLARRSGCACACYVLRLDFAAPGIPHTQGSPHAGSLPVTAPVLPFANRGKGSGGRSDEHTSELQSLMRSSYAVFCLKNKKNLRSSSIHSIH